MNKEAAPALNVPDTAIAIVGMACRLPGGNASYRDFWKFLKRGGNGIRIVPEDRWRADNFYSDNPDSIARSVSKWAGFLDDIRTFDAGHFGISPREAAAMDPQQRMLLEATCEAMQDAGRPTAYFSRLSTGVFVGISQSDYRGLQELRLTTAENYAGTGYALCINANRISHRLNLSGPSYAVDTACSSSMVALDQAVRNLRSGSCDAAVVAGVNVLAHPSSFIAFSKAGMLSPTGILSPFDAAANGFVRGEGVGVVVIKPYARAVADGDRIHAVIRATAVNQDGHTSTITAPNQEAQFAMLDALIRDSGVPRGHIGYVEAHGTGTPIGDPVEAGAIGRAIGQYSRDPVHIGSVKANVGHLESGAGITGLIKAVLCVQQAEIPPSRNFRAPNPDIPLDALNLAVPRQVTAFPDFDGARHAVINSFGFGGTNGSALISSPPLARMPSISGAKLSPATGFPLFFPVSAATADGVAANARSLHRALIGKGALARAPLDGVSRALATRRDHLSHRAVVIARDRRGLLAGLRLLAKGDAEAIARADNIVKGQVQAGGKLCFMFSGQGSQWWAMARELLTGNDVFRRAVEAFDAEFRRAAGWSIKDELLRDEADSRIDDTTVTQPALFAIQAGLAALWRGFGVRPDMVLGHSIGEAAAAHVAGGLTLKGAAAFLSKRGMIRDQLGQRGAMAAIGLNHEDVGAILPDHGKLGIAAINGPGSTTVSGDHDEIDAFVEEFRAAHSDTFIRKLKVDTAWHSYQLDAGEAWFRREVAQIDWQVPRLPFISTVTGRLESRFDTDYGWQNLRRPVLFQKGVETALRLGATTFVELGPHSTLAGPAASTAMEAGLRPNVLNSLDRSGADFDCLARTAARLFVAGHGLDWSAITAGQEAGVELPAFVWQGEVLWKGSEEAERLLTRPFPHPFIGKRSPTAAALWESEINLKGFPYLRDHRLQGDVIFPAAGYIDAFLAMGKELFGDDRPLEIENMTVNEAMFVPTEGEVIFNCVYDFERSRARFYSRQRDTREDWVLRSEAILRPSDAAAPKPIAFDPEQSSLTRIEVSEIYDSPGREYFINYGQAFQVVRDLWMTRRRSVARIRFPEEARMPFADHPAHPTMLDGALQVTEPYMTLKGIRRGRRPGDNIYLPVGAERFRLFAPFPEEILVHARQLPDAGGQDRLSGFVVTDMAGKVLMTADGLAMRALPTKAEGLPTDEVKPSFVTESMVELRTPDADGAPGAAPGHWLLLAEPGPAARKLRAAMEAHGARVDLLDRDTLGARVSDGLNDRYGAAFEAGAIEGIVFAGSLSLPEVPENAESAELLQPVEAVVRDLISVGDLMDFHRSCEAGLARLVVLTSGATEPAEGGATGTAMLMQAPVAAVGRGLATETPEYTVRMIDADAAALRRPDDLATRILTRDAETEIALRDGKVYAPRLSRQAETDLEPKLLTVDAGDRETNFQCTMQTPGVIDDLRLCEVPLEPLDPDQVRVRVAAVGLNFRDVMAVTGLLPREAEPEPAHLNLGLEFGAVVDAVGAQVEGFAPGDRVMGLGRRCLQRFMNVDPRALTRLPDHLSLEEAATIPSAFATAHYALNHVGRMRAGDRVLIHVATGGVGTAAVQLAQAAGAEIFATAGSPAKRRILRDLGIRHVFDSRSLKFADDVMRATGKRGVDVLLNSLPGDYISKGLDIMAPYGRFLEIGKRDVYADSAVGLRALRRNVSLSVIDLAAMGEERPDLLGEIFADLMARFGDKKLAPLPITAFPVSRIAEAFRYMSQARHVGKVVVTLDEDSFRVRRDPDRPIRLRADASYLVTGGTRGFCLDIAEWMSRAGAGRLVLASRSGAVDPGDEKRLARMTARGTEVETVALDVTDGKAVAKLLAKLGKGKRPLRGVVHGAAVIKDGFANQLTDEMIADVLAPKIAGGWNLHRGLERAGIEPDFFVGFSSISQVLGSGGQTNYVAGNAFLDALARYRQARGKPGVAMDWGAIGEAGFVARSDGLASYLESIGLIGLTRREAETGMAAGLSREVTSLVYAKADWQKIAGANPAVGDSPRFADLLVKKTGTNSKFRAHLMSLEGDALREEAAAYVISEICTVLKIDKAAIQSDRPMSELGLDSLSFFELKMRIETGLNMVLPVSKFLKAPTIDELKDILAEEIELLREAEANAAAQAEEGAGEGDAGRAAVDLLQPSDAQLGAYRDAVAPLTSRSARTALEHVVSAELPRAVTEKELQAALRRLTRRHPMLCLDVSRSDKTKLTLGGPGPGLGGEGPLDVESGEFVRLSTRKAGGVTALTLRMHAAVGDMASAGYVMDDLVALLSGRRLDRALPRKTIGGLAAACRFDPDTAQGRNDRGFWWYAMQNDPAPVTFAERGRALAPVGTGRNHGPAAVLEAVVPKTAGEADLLIALAAALRGIAGEAGPVLISRAASVRDRLHQGKAVGAFDILQPLVVTDDASDARARAGLERILRHACDHPGFDSHAAARDFAERYCELGVTPFQFGFAMLGRDQACLTAQDDGIAFDLALEVLGEAGKRRLRLAYDTDVLDADAARRILKAVSKAARPATGRRTKIADTAKT